MGQAEQPKQIDPVRLANEVRQNLEQLVAQFNVLVRELHAAADQPPQEAPTALVDAARAFAEEDAKWRDDYKLWDAMNDDERARWSHRCALGRTLELVAFRLFAPPPQAVQP